MVQTKNLIFITACILFCCVNGQLDIPDFSGLSPSDFPHMGDHSRADNDFPVKVTCNQVRFTQCTAQFYVDAGLSGPFSSAQQLANAINNLILNGGSPAVIKFCSANTKFTQCMTSQMIKICFNPLTFLANGNTLNDAFGYSILYYRIHFGCGSGLMTTLYNFDCIERTSLQKNATLAKCTQSFMNNVNNDAAHYCSYGQMYMQCVANVFNAPQCNSGVGWLECEHTRIAVQIPAPLCSVRCKVQQPVQKVTAVVEDTDKDGQQEGSKPQAGDPVFSGDDVVSVLSSNNIFGDGAKHLQNLASVAAATEKILGDKKNKEENA